MELVRGRIYDLVLIRWKMDGDPLDCSLEPLPRWIQQKEHHPEGPSNLQEQGSKPYDISKKKSDPGLLLDQWLADQEWALRRPSGRVCGTAVATSDACESVLEGTQGTAGSEMADFSAPSAKHNCPKASGHLPREEQVPVRPASSPVGWKLQLFKAAVGIRKRWEEYDTKRRSSLIAFIKHAMQKGNNFLPTHQSEESKEKTGIAATAARHTSVSFGKATDSYKWRWDSSKLVASRPSRKRSSFLVSRRAHEAAPGSWRQRNEGLMRRFVLLQRKQLLASHRLRLLPADLQVESLLGEGASGRVWRVRHRGTGKQFALKVIQKGDSSPTSSSCMRLYAERHVLVRSGLSRHLVKLHAAFQDERHLFLLEELLPGPSLLSLLQSRGTLPEEEARRYAAQLALAVHAVHKLGFIHRDIKPENIVLDRNGDVKLIDLGLAARPATRRPVQSTPDLPSAASVLYGASPAPTVTLPIGSSAAIEGAHADTSASIQKTKPLEEGESRIRGQGIGGCHCCSPMGPFGVVEGTDEVPGPPPGTSEALLESFAAWRLRHLAEGGARSCVGTLHYMAPEVAGEHKVTAAFQSPRGPSQTLERIPEEKNPLSSLKGRRYSTKADWWSFGAVLFECLFGHPPFGRFSFIPETARKSQTREHQREDPPASRGPSPDTVLRRRHTTLSQDPSSLGHATMSSANSGTSGADPSQMACGLISNPELLICMIRNWRKYLQIPPFPFVIPESQDAAGTTEAPGKAPQTNASEVSMESVDLLRNLLCEEESRFGFRRIKHHPWFNSLDWDAELRTLRVTTFRKKSKSTNRWDVSNRVSVAASASSPLKPCSSPRPPGSAINAGAMRSHYRTSGFATTCSADDSRLPPDNSDGAESPCLPGGSTQRVEQHGNRIQGMQTLHTDLQSGVAGATESSSGSSPQCASTASDTEANSLEAEALKMCPENATLEAQGDEVGRDAEQSALCSCAATKPGSHQNNKWLLDLRFLGFEFDRRRAQAREAAKRLRAACEAASRHDGVTCFEASRRTGTEVEF